MAQITGGRNLTGERGVSESVRDPVGIVASPEMKLPRFVVDAFGYSAEQN
jgi:hypothetical protein